MKSEVFAKQEGQLIPPVIVLHQEMISCTNVKGFSSVEEACSFDSYHECNSPDYLGNRKRRTVFSAIQNDQKYMRCWSERIVIICRQILLACYIRHVERDSNFFFVFIEKVEGK